jgi:integrase
MSQGTSWVVPREKMLSKDELKRVLEVAKRHSERDYTFFAIAANVGARLCEIVHIKRDDINQGKLRLTRRKKKVLRPELVDILPDLAVLLHGYAHKMAQGSEWLFDGKAAPCIINRSNGVKEQVCAGGHVSKRDIQRRWELVLAEAGLRFPGRGIHQTRHYAITEFYAKHRDLRAAQMFAGHSSSTITERYAHVVDLKDKILAMDATL